MIWAFKHEHKVHGDVTEISAYVKDADIAASLRIRHKISEAKEKV